MLDFKNNTTEEVVRCLLKAGFHLIKKNDKWTLLIKEQESEAQDLINNITKSVPTLSPRQFKYMLAITRLDVTMNTVLEQLRNIDLETYARCKSQLDGASFFEWEKALELYTQVKPLILSIDPSLDYTLERLKEYWITCSTNYI